VNLSGAFYCLRYQVPAMLKNGGGAIVNMSSILGQVAFPNAPAYVAAKHGLVGLTRACALEYASQGIRINVVGPAFIQTPMISSITTIRSYTTSWSACIPLAASASLKKSLSSYSGCVRKRLLSLQALIMRSTEVISPDKNNHFVVSPTGVQLALITSCLWSPPTSS